jgi:hypothetical protein
MPAKKENRCWPGYEPVPGKSEHAQGSCRPKADSKSSPSEKQFRAKRRKQLDKWEVEHPKTRRSAAQHLSAPGTKKANKKAASRRKPAAARKKTASKAR